MTVTELMRHWRNAARQKCTIDRDPVAALDIASVDARGVGHVHTSIAVKALAEVLASALAAEEADEPDDCPLSREQATRLWEAVQQSLGGLEHTGRARTLRDCGCPSTAKVYDTIAEIEAELAEPESAEEPAAPMFAFGQWVETRCGVGAIIGRDGRCWRVRDYASGVVGGWYPESILPAYCPIKVGDRVRVVDEPLDAGITATVLEVGEADVLLGECDSIRGTQWLMKWNLVAAPAPEPSDADRAEAAEAELARVTRERDDLKADKARMAELLKEVRRVAGTNV